MPDVLGTYDPAKIAVIVGGRAITGFSSDNVVTVERDNPSFEDEAGADQEVVRYATNDFRGTITIFLQPTSLSNAYLSALINADELTGSNVVAVMVRDTLGNDLHMAPQAWVQGHPRVVQRKGVEAREWRIRCSGLRMGVLGA